MTCREKPTYGKDGSAKYARIKDAIKARREPHRIKNSIKSEVRNMVHNSFPEIVIPLDPPMPPVLEFLDPKIVAEYRKHKGVE